MQCVDVQSVMGSFMSGTPSYASPGQTAVRLRTSGKAVASLVLGIIFCIPLITSLLAVFFAIGGMRATREPTVRGRGIAIAGLVLGICGVVMWAGVGAFIGFLIVASEAPRAVARDFVTKVTGNDIAAALAICDPSLSASGLETLHKYIVPFGAYVDQTCTGVYLRSIPAGERCDLSGYIQFSSGSHPFNAVVVKNAGVWKIYGFHIY